MTTTILLILNLLVFLLLGVIYHPTLIWLYERFTAPDSYYSHGFLVPLIITYLLWLKKDELEPAKWRSQPIGLILIILSLLIHFLGLLAGVHFVSGYTFLPLAFGLSIYFLGDQITKKIAFPLAFLIFMLPLPLVAVNAISFPMRMYATKVSVLLLDSLSAIPVSSEGFRILLPNDSLVIGSPCSGLRSLISFLAIGSVFAYLMKGGLGRKALLLFLAVFAALGSNILRILLLCLAAYWWGAKAIQGTFHDVSGYVVFLLAFSGIWYARKAIESLNLGKGRR